MRTKVEKLVFEAEWRKTSLPGLEYTLKQLTALSEAIKRVQGQIAGISTNALYNLSAKQYTAMARSGSYEKTRTNVLSKMYGFDPKDVKKQADLTVAAIEESVAKVKRAWDRAERRTQREFEKGNRKGKPGLSEESREKYRSQIAAIRRTSPFADESGTKFRDALEAGKWFESYAKKAMAAKQNAEKAFATIMRGSGGSGVAMDPAAFAELLKTTFQSGTGGGGGKKGRKSGSSDPAVFRAAVESDSKALMERTVVTPADPEQATRTTLKSKTGTGVEKVVYEGSEQVATTVTESVAQNAKAAFKAELAAMEKAFKGAMPGAAAGGAGKVAALRTDAVAQARAYYQKHPELAQLGLGGMLDQFTDKTIPNAVAAQLKRLSGVQKALAARRLKAQAADEKQQIQAQEEELAARIKGIRQDLRNTRRRTANARRLAAQEQKADTAETLAAQKETYQRATNAAARAAIAQQQILGATLVDQRTNKLTGNLESAAYDLAENGVIKRTRVRFGKSGAGIWESVRPDAAYARAKNAEAEKAAANQAAIDAAGAHRPSDSNLAIENQAALAMADVRHNEELERKARAEAERQAKAQKKAADRQQKQAAADAENASRRSAAEAKVQWLRNAGAERTAFRRDALTGRTTGETYKLTQGNQVSTYEVAYGKAGASVKLLTREMKDAHGAAELLGGDFLRNTVKVTAWSASVAVLYQTLGLATHSFKTMLDIGMQQAQLDQVFSKLGGTTAQLTSDVLALAAANGRSSEEAMTSALQWARMGLTRMQVNEAVRVSLMAANSAQMDAATTTEHLQAIMQTYGLRVGNLRTVLGELVYITNTYNVRTGDLLDGLSRTAAAAKQAGMPLAELQGILAATIGSTGQTGANIGNATKSIMLALSNPALQQLLRGGYRFEVTTGAEQIKPMNQLLGELYVRFMKLNDAQRQSLLFSVAGRTQANRMAAMMENYVRAQVLAVNAQLNLNAAEEENQKVIESLKARLTGLTTEWERFVVIQSNHGPVQVLQQLFTGLKNVIALMNTPGMSLFTTGILGIGAVGMARAGMAAAMVGAGAKKGFLGRSGAAIMQEAGALNMAASDVVNAMALRSADRRNASQSKADRDHYYNRLRQLNPKMPAAEAYAQANQQMNRGPGLFSRTLLKWDAFANRNMSAGWDKMNAGGMLGLTRGFGALQMAAGGAAKALTLCAVALAEFIVPMLVVGGLVYGFNRVMKAAQGDIEETEAALAGFNREAEKARSAAEAFEQAGSALSTLKAAMSDTGGTMRPGDLAKMMEQSMGLLYLDAPEAEQAGRRQALEAELKTMNDQARVARLRTEFDAQGARYAWARLDNLQKEFAETVKTMAARQKDIDNLKASRWIFGADKRKENIAELEKLNAQDQQKQIDNLTKQRGHVAEELADWAARNQYQEKYLTGLERERVGLQGIAEVFRGIQAVDPVQSTAVAVATLESQRAFLRDRLAKYDAAIKGGQDTSAVVEVNRRNTADEILKKRQELLGLDTEETAAKAEYGSSRSRWYGDQARLDESLKQINARRSGMKAQIEQLERRIKDPAALGIGDDNLMMLQNQRQETQRRYNQLGAELTAQREDQRRAAMERQRQYGAARGELGAGASRYGMDEGARLLQERDHLRREIAALERQRAGADPKDQPRMVGQLIRDQELAYRNLLAIRQRHADVEREIKQMAIDQNREFAKSFFGSGPAEMLRKLAAFRTARRGGTSWGQLFSMDPGMREDVGRLTGLNPDMGRLRNEHGRLEAWGRSNVDGNDPWGDKFDAMLTRFSDGMNATFGGLSEELKRIFDAQGVAVRNASQVMDTLATNASLASRGLADLAVNINKVLGFPGFGGKTGLTASGGNIGGGSLGGVAS